MTAAKAKSVVVANIVVDDVDQVPLLLVTFDSVVGEECVVGVVDRHPCLIRGHPEGLGHPNHATPEGLIKKFWNSAFADKIDVKEEYNSVANEEIYQQLINEVETAKRTNSTWQLDKELIIIKKIE